MPINLPTLFHQGFNKTSLFSVVRLRRNTIICIMYIPRLQFDDEHFQYQQKWPENGSWIFAVEGKEMVSEDNPVTILTFEGGDLRTLPTVEAELEETVANYLH